MPYTKVLIAENDRVFAALLQQQLITLGYEIAGIVSSGEEAVSACGSRDVDIVLMDMTLDEILDGVEAAHEIRRIKSVPLIYVTSNADLGTIERAKLTEPLGFLRKPVRPAALQAAIEVSLFKHARERERSHPMR